MATATLRSRARDERGSMSIQLVVLMPALFAIAFTGLQAGLFYYGRSAAMSAATTAARAAAAENGTTDACHAAANTFIAGLGDVLTSPDVTCTQTGTTISVTVAGNTLSVIPGWSPRVEQATNLPKERVT